MSADITSLEVESERTYIVYNKDSGDIVHIHRVTIHRGAEHISDDRAELRAREVAAHFGQSDGSIAVLRADAFDLRTPQRVDVKTRQVVADGDSVRSAVST